MLTEIGGVSRVTEACDWWSLGALLFELLTGMVSEGSTTAFSLTEDRPQLCHFCTIPANSVVGSWLLTHSWSLCLQPLWQLHPAGIHSHTQLVIPDHLSTAAASLLTEVRFEA